MIHYSDFLGRDNRESYAILRYILIRCCRIKNNEYQPMDFMQLKWIIDRCNFIAGKYYGLTFLSYDLLDWINDSNLVPETFDCDWEANYAIGEHGKIVLDDKGNPVKVNGFPTLERDFLSIGDITIMNIVINRWKLYGRFTSKIGEWLYTLKQKFKKGVY